jgi:AcrR family transcriptional regulator
VRKARVRDPEVREEQLLQAAAECFVEKGFHRATMQDIASRAGLSVGLFYLYFKRKQDIIEALIARTREAMLKLLTDLATDDERLVATLLAPSTMTDVENRHGNALQAEILAEAGRNPSVRKLLAESDNAQQSVFTKAIEHAQQRGRIDPQVSPRTVAYLLGIFVDGLIVRQGASYPCDPELAAAANELLLTRLLLPGRQ